MFSVALSGQATNGLLFVRRPLTQCLVRPNWDYVNDQDADGLALHRRHPQTGHIANMRIVYCPFCGDLSTVDERFRAEPSEVES